MKQTNPIMAAETIADVTGLTENTEPEDDVPDRKGENNEMKNYRLVVWVIMMSRHNSKT